MKTNCTVLHLWDSSRVVLREPYRKKDTFWHSDNYSTISCLRRTVLPQTRTSKERARLVHQFEFSRPWYKNNRLVGVRHVPDSKTARYIYSCARLENVQVKFGQPVEEIERFPKTSPDLFLQTLKQLVPGENFSFKFVGCILPVLCS